jgi:hypothetical protein
MQPNSYNRGGGDMDADLHFKIGVIGVGALCTILVSLAVFTR